MTLKKDEIHPKNRKNVSGYTCIYHQLILIDINQYIDVNA